MATTHRPQQPRRTPPTNADEGWLAQLEADILAEDIEDARREKRRLKLSLPEPPRNLGAYEGFADLGTRSRRLG